MTLSPETKQKILSVINAFETGSAGGDYGKVTIMRDGPGGMRQITYGRSQTTEFGNLPELLRDYVAAKGQYAGELCNIPNVMGRGESLCDDKPLLMLLRKAGSDPVMRRVQDEFFDREYWQPALRWAETHGFTLPLSMLVIYDSFVQSGRIMTFLRVSFKEKTPSSGGREKTWVSEYIRVRHRWLSANANPDVRKSAYRTRDLARLVEEGAWMLDKPVVVHDVAIA